MSELKIFKDKAGDASKSTRIWIEVDKKIVWRGAMSEWSRAIADSSTLLTILVDNEKDK